MITYLRKNKGKMLFHLRRCMSGRKLRQWTVCQKPAGSRDHAPGRPPHSGTSEWYVGKRGGLSSDGGRFRDDRPEKETAEPADRILCRVNSIKNQQKKIKPAVKCRKRKHVIQYIHNKTRTFTKRPEGGIST